MPAGLMVPHEPVRPGHLYYRESIPPGPARERKVAAMRKEMERRAAKLGDAIERLRTIVLTHDPVTLLESIALPASMGVLGPDAEDDAPATTNWDAKIEYLQGLALSGPPGTAGVTEEITTAAIAALGAVYDAAHADLFVRSIEEGRSDSGALDATSFMLRLEAMSDRMAGYAVHLEKIDAAVFDPHRAFYLDQVGFCPSDVVRLVRRRVRVINDMMQRATVGFRDAVERGPLRSDDEETTGAFRYLYTAMTTANRWEVDDVAESVSLPRDQVAAMMTAASVPFDSQRGFRSPFDQNAAFDRPLVRLENGQYLAPLPWSLAHNVHGLVRALASENRQLADAYQRHRADATERLINEALQPVFGATVVHRGQHFVSTLGAGEIDCLVSGSRAWCIEAKSQSLTEPARRGHRPRIERTTRDVVRRAIEQTERATTYILKDGRRDFAPKQGGPTEPRLPPGVSECLETVVSLERMDPVKALGLDLTDNEGRTTWLTGIADFLMVVDILDDPATLLDFVTQRSLAAAAGVMITMESDGLEGYLEDRLESIIETASTSGPEAMVMLGYGSSKVNRYFTMLEAGMDDAEKPSPRIPPVIRRALRDTYDGSESWTRAAQVLCALAPSVWKTWRKYLRRKGYERGFLVPGGEVVLRFDTEATSTRLISGDDLSLVVSESGVT